MIKKVASMLLALTMLLSAFTTVFANQMQSNDGIHDYTQDEMDAIAAGTTLEELYEIGMTLEELLALDAETDAVAGENFSANQRKALRQHGLLYAGFLRARDGRIIYPNFYGGSYIDHSGQLVFLIVESSLEQAYRHDNVRTILDAGVNYRFVEFAYSELIAAHETIANITYLRRFRYGCRYSGNIGHGGNDARINRAVIGLVVYNEEMITGFRRYVYDSPMIIFEPSDWGATGGNSNAPFCYDTNREPISSCEWGYLS